MLSKLINGMNTYKSGVKVSKRDLLTTMFDEELLRSIAIDPSVHPMAKLGIMEYLFELDAKKEAGITHKSVVKPLKELIG